MSFLGSIGAGHGAQPSFEQLSQQTTGNRPGYLKMPMVLPSVRAVPGAANEDEDEDLEALD